MKEDTWTENVILVDADYVDSVAFDLTVNFERMLGRRIPEADLALWAECVAMDGGLREGDHQTSLVLIHDRGQGGLRYFKPSDYAAELNGKAFSGRLGEFLITAVATEEMAGKEQLFSDMLELTAQQKEVKRVMLVVPETTADGLRLLLKRWDSDGRRTTLFTMQPVGGGAFCQEILGYSLMAALGISGREVDECLERHTVSDVQ